MYYSIDGQRVDNSLINSSSASFKRSTLKPAFTDLSYKRRLPVKIQKFTFKYGRRNKIYAKHKEKQTKIHSDRRRNVLPKSFQKSFWRRKKNTQSAT